MFLLALDISVRIFVIPFYEIWFAYLLLQVRWHIFATGKESRLFPAVQNVQTFKGKSKNFFVNNGNDFGPTIGAYVFVQRYQQLRSLDII
jgi:hypothetical protein